MDPYTKLHMVIHGDKGDTEKIYLTPEGGRLEPGKLYTVTVTTTDVGNVSTCTTGHPKFMFKIDWTLAVAVSLIIIRKSGLGILGTSVAGRPNVWVQSKTFVETNI